ncbi:hypothetical protein CARUB_v10019521mg [Capsella rubella]|uniref:MADS-box domain-containing protein n=1 Tax=Capsella rubella TaxID=81985 RepID=R0H9P9_9BRAS|nr:hypothetical protein CARUB_v10019521mg [Capsella rubella]
MSSNVSDQMRRGTKRKIEIKKRDTKQQRSVACSKRRQTLFSKAANLCLLSGANVAVFVTSPAENSDVVYSFSGYSPASVIADCYFSGKSPPKVTSNPQSKLGFWWEAPDLYRYCDDLSELNVIEDRMMRTKKYLMAFLEKQEKSQSLSDSDQNPSSSSLDQNPNFSSPSCSLEKICDESSSQATCYTDDQNPRFCESSSLDQSRYLVVKDDLDFVDSLWETEKSITNEDQSFWDNVFCLNNDNNNLQVPLPDH